MSSSCQTCQINSLDDLFDLDCARAFVWTRFVHIAVFWVHRLIVVRSGSFLSCTGRYRHHSTGLPVFSGTVRFHLHPAARQSLFTSVFSASPLSTKRRDEKGSCGRRRSVPEPTTGLRKPVLGWYVGKTFRSPYAPEIAERVALKRQG